jgi:aminobenzoyl-glutamate utilization protein A
MLDDIEQRAHATAAASRDDLVAMRRTLHRIPEPGFCEYRTAVTIARRLGELGYDLALGAEASDLSAAHAVPHDTATWFRAANDDLRGTAELAAMEGGATGIVATKRFGPGPTVAFRFDIDGLPIQESDEGAHAPAREGFASQHAGWMHACGHDGHATLGLGLAAALNELSEHARGTIKLVFQPAEEGTKGGAAAITARGHLDGVDLFVATHLGLTAVRTGEIVCGTTFMGTFKYRVRFIGRGAHVVLAPHTGRNALLAAATAATTLHGLAPHPDGWFSVNVGVLRAGTEQGVTPAEATIDFGAWYDSPELQEYLRERGMQVLKAAAALHDVKLEVEHIGEAPYVPADRDLGERLEAVARRVPGVASTSATAVCRAGEDATVFMDRVRRTGGGAAYVLVGSDLPSGHHTPEFDFDEESLVTGTAFLTSVAIRGMAGAYATDPARDRGRMAAE